MDLISVKLQKLWKNKNWIFYELKKLILKNKLTFYKIKKLEEKWIFLQAKKVEKKQTRKTTVKNENKFEFSKLSDLKENNVFTFNLPTWKSSKYMFLENKKEHFTFNLLTQKNDEFYQNLGSSFWPAW